MGGGAYDTLTAPSQRATHTVRSVSCAQWANRASVTDTRPIAVPQQTQARTVAYLRLA